MSILHKYILKILLRNLLLSILIFTLLFLVIDFFDRIDNIIAAGGSFGSTILYFLYKIPLTINLMLPIAMLVSTLFTFGLLSKNSELVSMRAAGLSVMWLARPLLITSFIVSLISLVLNETIIPVFQRRVKEIYTIDIQQRDRTGRYSQTDFWWRKDNRFLSVDVFDSRSNTMKGISIFQLRDNFDVLRRTDASEVSFLDPSLGWSMKDVTEYHFIPHKAPEVSQSRKLPLPLSEEPEDFYNTKADIESMTFRGLRKYIHQQAANGVPVVKYMADLQEKLAFPFISFIVSLIALPFALKPARTGSLAPSFVAGMLIGFTYYVVHSFSIAMGRAEFLPPLLAAWMANIVMGFVGIVLNLGTEAPL